MSVAWLRTSRGVVACSIVASAAARKHRALEPVALNARTHARARAHTHTHTHTLSSLLEMTSIKYGSSSNRVFSAPNANARTLSLFRQSSFASESSEPSVCLT